MTRKIWLTMCVLGFSSSVFAQTPGGLAQECALKCLKEKHIGYFPCMGNCVNGKPLTCGNGRVESNENCGNCGTDAGCASGADCLKTGEWNRKIPGGEVYECSTCGDGIASRGENPLMFPDQACLVDYNGVDGCGSKNGKCGFTADCRCTDCLIKRPWMGCRSNETCENTGRKFECVAAH